MKDDMIANNCSIQISQYDMQTPNETILSDLIESKMDLYGFTTYVWNYDKVVTLTQQLKEVHPDVTIILGGPQASGLSEVVLKRNPTIDYVIKGEGELAFRSFLNSSDRNEVPGLIFRNNGNIVTNPEVRIDDLDILLLPYENKEYRDYLDRAEKPIRAAIETSRGCPFSCAYCTWGRKKMRYFDLERLKSAFKYLFNHENVSTIYITDSNPFLKKKRSKELLRFIIENNIHKKLVTFEVSPEYITDDEIVDLIAQLHHEEFAFGVQSTSPKVLNMINRRFNSERYRNNIELIRKRNSKVEFWFSLIIGLPGDNYAQFSESVEFVLNLKPTGIYFHELLCLPGSDIFNDPEKYGIEFMLEAPHKILTNRTFPADEYNHAKKLSYFIYLIHRSGLSDKLFELKEEQKKEYRLVDLYDEFNLFVGEKLEILGGEPVQNVFSWFFEQKATEFLEFSNNKTQLELLFDLFKQRAESNGK